MDFGLELLGSPSHGNLALELAPGLEPVKVNTAIMSYNSPVIYNLTTDLHQNSIDATEFSGEAVQCFSRACYSGQLQTLEINLFRDMFKMSVVFKVTWLESRCVDFYKESVGCTLRSSYVYTDLLAHYEEAQYAKSKLKNEVLLTFLTTILRSWPNEEKRFINEYITDINALSTKEIESACLFVGGRYSELLVESVIRSLQKDQTAISPSCNYILENVDLAICLKNDPVLIERLQQSVVSSLSIDVDSKRSISVVMKMYQKICEICWCNQPASNRTPPNLFHCFNDIKAQKDIKQLIEYIAHDVKDSNMFMLLDGLVSWTYENSTPPPQNCDYKDVFAMIQKVKCDLKWNPVPMAYVKKLLSSDGSWFDGLQKSKRFAKAVDPTDNCLIFYSKKFKPSKLFALDGRKLVLKTSSENGCKESGKCAVMLNVNSNMPFNIQVVFGEDSKSEEEIHFHNELASFSTLHLCLFLEESQKYLPLSWYGKPELDETDSVWRWGAVSFHGHGKGKFINHRTQYKHRWELTTLNTEYRLAAFVKTNFST